MAPPVDTDRGERALRRSIAKRDELVGQMKILYDIAVTLTTKPDSIPIFLARKKDIEIYIVEFNLENDNILDQLIVLDRDNEYSTKHIPVKKIFMEQYYYVIATSSKLGLNDEVQPILPTCSQIQLPKITLPSFSGDILQWRPFRDTFVSLVHDNKLLSKIEKFHYLLSSVTGPAASCVRSLPLTEDNYYIVWNNLHVRYDNKRVLMTAHLDAMFKFTPLTSESLTNLKRFLSTFQENVASIKALNVENLEGFLLFYIASRTLDPMTKRLFESEHHDEDAPTIDLLLTFVQTRCQILQNSTSSVLLPLNKQHFSSSPKTRHTKSSLLATSRHDAKSCIKCHDTHLLHLCPKFIQCTAYQRFKFAQSRRMCMNCLSPQHRTSECSSIYTCRQCNGKHHTLLHLDKAGKGKYTPFNNNSNDSPITDNEPTTLDQGTSGTSFVGTSLSTNNVILGTAVIRILDHMGQWVPVRTLLDTGSQISVITNSCATRLGLKRQQCKTSVIGLSQTSVIDTKGSTHCVFVPLNNEEPKISCEPLIIPRITGPMPNMKLNSDIRRVYNHVEFADPRFDIPQSIDFLLGADVYQHILGSCSRVIHTPGLPSAYETLFGWIILGTSTPNTFAPCVSLLLTTEPSIEKLLNRFWEVEEPSPPVKSFTDDQKCEEHFIMTTTRDSTGRFSVSLPFKRKSINLGDSQKMAISRFYNLERKLQKDREVYDLYRTFMQEYEDLGHMVLTQKPSKYYIPHHAVVKRNDVGIKLRVVFDASANTSSGKSLNDMLHVGPKLQTDISKLLHLCRFHKYMFTTDICKMYRQIKINDPDHEYQHILWRKNPTDQLNEYKLLTVTYGITSSPFQAIRVLHQLEKEDGHLYPYAGNILSTQTYVDDIISGHSTVVDLLKRYEDIVKLLGCAGFELKKWSSNCSELINRIPVEDRAMKISFEPKNDMSIKILGLHWDPTNDTFGYHGLTICDQWTKRKVLSTIAQLYDPIGALAPVIFWAKYFMQLLWKSGLKWDDQLPLTLLNTWEQFASELPLVSKVKLNRYIDLSSYVSTQLLGFSDASEKGYGCVIYLRCVFNTGLTKVYFITAKSKVAPLKMGRIDKSLTIPRLELCGTLLLAQTLYNILTMFKNMLPVISVHAWTDSCVVLSWLTSEQSHFKIFVTNRLAKIAELIPRCQWHYVSTFSNPADCISRGILPSQIIAHQLYWNGPSFLLLPENEWPTTMFEKIPHTQLPDYKENQNVPICNVACVDSSEEWFSRFSTLNRMQRVTAWIIRFRQHTKGIHLSGPLSRDELEHAMIPIIVNTQKLSFSNLLHTLSIPDARISPRSLAQLSPFIDEKGIIRVGGRIRNSNVSEGTRNPILLPKSSTLTKLLVQHYHLVYLHAGQQLISSLLRRKFWVLSDRSAIKSVIFKCVVCARHRANTPRPIMADLPSFRVQQSRPFSNVGVDFAGPFTIKYSCRRNVQSIKCYLAIFVCMAVKAVHIEVVSDLSANTFLATLHRFVSRRGIPSNIYSDCGTNFKGTDRLLESIFKEPTAQALFIGAIPCKWHFNPPAAPHFGGIWEAAVKSTKYHLRRVLGNQLLTFEELSTLAIRVEGVLNSRPLTAMSTDPNELCSLSPGDFLIGQPLVAIPEKDITSTTSNRLNRWELVRQMYQSFWKRWSNEYLTSLQRRCKWVHQQPNMKIGDLVLVQAPNQPPTHWKLGRVHEVHPGPDNIVRVVTIFTSDGMLKRPVVKLAKLPTEQ